jgi:ureidoacrylate peracid hydrolase
VGAEVTAPNGELSRILIRDTWNTEIVEELAPKAGDAVVYKSRFSGFHRTELHDILQARGIQQLIIVGATTSVCVDSTVRDAMFLDYHCLVVGDAMAEPIAEDAPRSNHEASLLTFELLFAHVTTTEDVFAALGATAALPA